MAESPRARDTWGVEHSARAHAWWEWALLVVTIVVGVPAVLFLLLVAPAFFFIGGPGIGIVMLGAAVAAVHAPFHAWVGPRYGRKVVWGCTGATVSAMVLFVILVAWG